MITGGIEAPANLSEEGKAELAKQESEVPAGVPDFWMIALRNHPDIENMVSEADGGRHACVDGLGAVVCACMSLERRRLRGDHTRMLTLGEERPEQCQSSAVWEMGIRKLNWHAH